MRRIFHVVEDLLRTLVVCVVVVIMTLSPLLMAIPRIALT
jgi:predicted ATPase